MPYVLSCYPLSSAYRSDIERRLGGSPEYMTLTELRQQPVSAMLRALLAVKGAALRIAIEDETSRALLPVLGMLASLTRARRLVVTWEDQSETRLRRLQAFVNAAGVAMESLLAAVSMRQAHRVMMRLLSEPRSDAVAGSEDRVAYLNCNLWFGVKAGGSVGHISGVVNALGELGYDVDFYTVGGRLMVRDRARLIPLSPPKSLALPFERSYFRFDSLCGRQIAAQFSTSRPRFIYQRLSIGNFSGVRLSRRFGVPLVIEYNGSEVWVARNWGRPLRYERISQDAEDVCLRHAHLVVTISDVLADELAGRGVERSRIVVYPNCIDPELFRPEAFSRRQTDELRQSLGFSPGHTVATFVGTFGQWHGVDVLARAIASMVETHPHLFEQGLRFLLVGDGMKMGLVREILAKPEVSRVVSLTGLVPQRDAPRYLAASDILLSPHVRNADGSRFFGSPTKLFEYMAMGKAIVASDLDQLGQVLRPAIVVPVEGEIDASRAGEAIAVLFPPGDIRAFARGVDLLVQDRGLREGIGARARAVALEKYTWRHHVGVILEALDRVSPGTHRQRLAPA